MLRRVTGLNTTISPLGGRFSITVNPLDFKAGRMRKWIECHGEIVKEANLPQKIVGNIPREARLDLNCEKGKTRKLCAKRENPRFPVIGNLD